MLTLNKVPSIYNLNREQMDTVAKFATLDILKDQYKQEMKKNSADIDGAMVMFLKNKADKTVEKYKLYWSMFTKFLKTVHPLDVSPELADRYVFHLREQGLAQSTVNIYVSSISSFYSFMARWDYIKTNPFSGTKALPKRKRKKNLSVPTDADISVLLASYKDDLGATGRGSAPKKAGAGKMIVLIHLMVKYGFRVGAFENLEVEGYDFRTITKGKEFSGVFDDEDLMLIEMFNVDFHSVKGPAVEYNLNVKTKELYNDGKISDVFHPHSFRHYFAVSQYRSNKDIYRLRKLLNHSSVATTENYLESLKITL